MKVLFIILFLLLISCEDVIKSHICYACAEVTPGVDIIQMWNDCTLDPAQDVYITTTTSEDNDGNIIPGPTTTCTKL